MAKRLRTHLVFLFAVLAPAGNIGATPRTVHLSYVREPGTEQCPDERWIRQAVSARLGFDPFQETAPVRVEARIFPAAKGVAGSLTLIGQEEKVLGRRALASEQGDCLELASAIELAITIAVDPHYLTPTPKPQAPVTPPAPAITRPSAPSIDAGGGLLGSIGLSPAATPGLTVGLRMRWLRVSVSLEGRADLTSGVRYGSGRVDSSVLLGALSPCVHWSSFGACGLLSAGAIQVTGEIAPPARRGSSPLVLTGARLEVELPVGELAFLKPFVDVQAVLTRTSILSGDHAVWVTAPVTVTLGLAGWFSVI